MWTFEGKYREVGDSIMKESPLEILGEIFTTDKQVLCLDQVQVLVWNHSTLWTIYTESFITENFDIDIIWFNIIF